MLGFSKIFQLFSATPWQAITYAGLSELAHKNQQQHFFIFGDSTVSVDRSWYLTGGLDPSIEKYGSFDGHHRYTNSLVYLERLLAIFFPEKAKYSLHHYAYGGATTDDTSVQSEAAMGLASKGLVAQVEEFVRDQQSNYTTYSGGPKTAFVNVGGNDWYWTEFAKENARNLSDAAEVIDRLCKSVDALLQHVDKVFVANLPAYHLGPLGMAIGEEHAQNLKSYILTFNRLLVQRLGSRPSVYIMDVASAFDEIVEHPYQNGLDYQVLAVPYYHPENGAGKGADVSKYVWYDMFHLTGRAHELIAKILSERRK